MAFKKTPAEGQVTVRDQPEVAELRAAAIALEAPDQASQRVLVRIGSALTVLVAFLGQLGVEHLPKVIVDALPGFVPTTLERLLDGVIVVGVGAYLLETRLLKNYVEDRLQRLITNSQRNLLRYIDALVVDDFTKRVRDVEFLRRFKNTVLDNAEEAIRRASFAVDLPTEVDNFHLALREVRDQLDIWRTNYYETISLEPYPGRNDLCKMVMDTRWTYVNYNVEALAIPQVFTETVYKILGVPDENLFRITQLSVAGQDALGSLRVTTAPIGREQVEFAASLDTVELPAMRTSSAEGVLLRARTEYVRPRTQPLGFRYSRPVYKFVVSLRSFPDLHPQMALFAVGGTQKRLLDPYAPASQNGDLYQWDFDGWLLPNHGFVITFTSLSGGAEGPVETP